MTDMEAQANEFLRRKEWARAIEIYNQLLNASTNKLTKERLVSYLLGRSECCLELGQHEAVVSDCRKIIKLLADGNHSNNGARACRRLIQALFQLRRFSEAEMATKEWLSLFGASLHQSEVSKILEKLHTIPNTMEVRSNNQLDAELRLLETKLDAWTLRNGHVKPVSQTNGWPHDELQQQMICSYCCLSFNDRSELKSHCQSESHQMFIMSDEGRDWIWRPPPRGLSDAYSICENWSECGSCRYGAQCAEAHGMEELAEWKERFEYRRMKLQRASEKELYGKSYTEQLLERWIQAPSPERVMKENLEGVDDATDSDLITTVSSKTSHRDWTFVLTTKKFLNTVALLQDAHRNHFALKQVRLGQPESSRSCEEICNNQEWSAQNRIALVQNDTSGTSNGVTMEHRVTVTFNTDIYGTFRQSVVFDFGTEPVLVKHLCVDVIPVMDVDKIKEIRKEIVLSTTERWDIRNTEIISFASNLTPTVQTPVAAARENDWERELTNAYPFPQAETFSLTHATVTEKKLTRNNYRARMHELLFVEEMARYEQVARYNLTTKLRVTQSYMLTPNGMATSTAKYSHSGELFALMQLGKDISEDTSSGRLILNNCTTVLIASENAQINRDSSQKLLRVFEAAIEDKGKNVIYLRLSAVTVKELKMVPDSDFTAQVQFQLNRIPHCEWHYAVDKIADFRIIFPETYLEPSIPWTPQRQWSDTLDSRLNLKQKEAVVAITTPTYIPLPPILIIGPFGTGKTFTLAQAIKQLLLQPDTRILICTHSNSAADLYIKDYLHPYVEAGHEEARPLRIYYHKRWVATVNSIVQKYCLIDINGGIRNFRIPTLEDIMKHRIVVVTLSISMYLSTMGLPQGHFTHILLDEAAQAMECEAIMPLALASPSTRIVLAGDHMQLSPELFSQFCKERNMHVSLLERLYDHYSTNFPCKVLLCENYRAHEAIINFTSELFYEQKLISSGKQPRHEKYYPLTFFTTRGEDVQDQNSTAFYNNSEVYEVVERVSELRKKWPTAWGKLDDQSIGIMTPYADQVFRIRSELRKRRLGGISVERVLNVQGKQFRAIFLSTVRTRRTCTGSTDEVDYGFLSNSKLLNTAITRAQSLVAVVGDPVALCSIGRCRKVWERFIQICNENNSLYGITWTLLKSQLDGVELKKTYVLNPLAPEFVPRKFQTEAYIRMNSGAPQYSIPPQQQQQQIPVQIQQNPNPQQQQIPRFVGPFPPPKTSPMFPGPVVPMYYYPPNQPPPPHAQFQIRPPPPSAAGMPPAQQWPVNNLIISPNGENAQNQQNPPSNWNPQKPQPQYVVGNVTNVDLQHLSPSAMLPPLNGTPILPPQKVIPIPSPQMTPQQPLKAYPERSVHEMLIAPPYMRANIQNPSQAAELSRGICLPAIHPAAAAKIPLVDPISRPVDKEVMFLHNVHFPEVHRESPVMSAAAAVNSQMMLNHRPPHNGLSALLPPNVSLEEMLRQPRMYQAKWYHHLQETEGMEAAKRFEMVIHSALEKARQVQLVNIQLQNLEALRNAEEFDKSQIQQQQHQMMNHQQQQQMLNQIVPPQQMQNYQNIMCPAAQNVVQNMLPNANNWLANPTDKIPTIAQINFNKPIYLQDLETSIVLANLQNQQQANEEVLNINNAMFSPTEPLPWNCNPQPQSVPLYRRQGPQSSDSNKSSVESSDSKSAGSSGAFAGYARAAISNGIYDVNRIAVEPQQQQVLPHRGDLYQNCHVALQQQAQAHAQAQNWQHQMNNGAATAEYVAAKAASRGETVEEMIRRNATYASVLRSEHKNNETLDKGRDPFSVLSELRTNTTSVGQTEPGLYQYFA